MLTSFKLLNYRGFGEFELTGLGRVNLLVGANNSGKTSILEAVGLFASSGDMSRLWSTMSSRGEWLLHDRSQRGSDSGFALPYLFHGYRVDRGAEIRLEAALVDGRRSSLRLEVTEPPDDAPKWWRRGNEAEPRLLLGALQIVADDRVIPPSIPISDGWGIEWADIVELSRTRIDSQVQRAPVQSITTAAMSAEELVELVDAIQLTGRGARPASAADHRAEDLAIPTHAGRHPPRHPYARSQPPGCDSQAPRRRSGLAEWHARRGCVAHARPRARPCCGQGWRVVDR